MALLGQRRGNKGGEWLDEMKRGRERWAAVGAQLRLVPDCAAARDIRDECNELAGLEKQRERREGGEGQHRGRCSTKR